MDFKYTQNELVNELIKQGHSDEDITFDSNFAKNGNGRLMSLIRVKKALAGKDNGKGKYKLCNDFDK